MPSIDKDQVRMLVADVGFPEASKRTGIKQDTLYKWAKRKGWKLPIHHKQEASVQSVRSPAQAHAEALAEHSRETRMSIARSARKAADHIAEMTPAKIVKVSRGLKNITEVSEKAHGWNQNARSTSVFAQQAVVITDEEIDELQARLRRRLRHTVRDMS